MAQKKTTASAGKRKPTVVGKPTAVGKPTVAGKPTVVGKPAAAKPAAAKPAAAKPAAAKPTAAGKPAAAKPAAAKAGRKTRATAATPPASPLLLVQTELDPLWQRVRARLRAELGEPTFNSWFKFVRLGSAKRSTVVLEAPSEFISGWVEDNYTGRLLALWKQEHQGVKRVRVQVAENDWERQAEAPETKKVDVSGTRFTGLRGNTPAADDIAASVSNRSQTDNVSAPLNPHFSFEHFVVGKSNEMAYSAARRVCETDDVSFNPLFLYGGVGLGKTHLMHAIANELRLRRPEKRVLYLSAEQFMYQFIRALRFKNMMAFKEQFREVNVLMVDDIQFISGKNNTQEEFFHTFNALIDHKHQVVISADCSPSDLEGIEERIRSRLSWGLVADIHPSDYELRLGILQEKIAQMEEENKLPSGINVPHEVLELLAQRITTNIRELEGALNRIIVYAGFAGRAVNLEMTRDVLSDLLRANERRVTIEEIQRRVAEYYNMQLSDMLSERRAREIARPRQVAMYLAKQLTRRSLPDIGRKFGGRDHTTVIHAVKRVDSLRAEDKALDEDVDMLRRILGR